MVRGDLPYLALLLAFSMLGMARAGQGPEVSIGMTPTARSGPTPEIIATLPPDGSSTNESAPALMIIFSIPMNTSRTDITAVSLPNGLTATALVWVTSELLEIQYTGTLATFGAKRIGLRDRYFASVGNEFLAPANGYAFTYEDGAGGGGGSSGGDLISAKGQVKLNFSPKAVNKDKIVFTCVINLPKNYSLGGRIVDVFFGGVTQEFTLDGAGKALVKIGKLKQSMVIKQRITNNIGLGGAARLTCTLTGDFSDQLDDSGLVDITTPKTGVEVTTNVLVVLGGQPFDAIMNMIWKAKLGKSGSAKFSSAVR